MTIEEIREAFDKIRSAIHSDIALLRQHTLLERFVRYVAEGNPLPQKYADPEHAYRHPSETLTAFRELAREIVRGIEA